MENIEIYNRVIACGLIKEIELSMLRASSDDINKILKVIHRDLEITFSFEKNLICPQCVYEMMESFETRDATSVEKQDAVWEIFDWRKENVFVDDNEYKEMLKDKKDDLHLVSDNLFKRFCCNCLWKIHDVLKLTVKQFNDFVKDLSRSKSVGEFDAIIDNVKEVIRHI